MSARTRVRKGDCSGCRNNFYNDQNPMGVKECWSFKDAKMETRYRLHVDTPMAGYKKPYQKVRVPNCYHVSRWIYISKKGWESKR